MIRPHVWQYSAPCTGAGAGCFRDGRRVDMVRRILNKMYEEDFVEIRSGKGWWMILDMGCLNGRPIISMRGYLSLALVRVFL